MGLPNKTGSQGIKFNLSTVNIEMAKGKRNMTRKVLRLPQGVLNSVLGIAGSGRKGTVRVAKRAGKGAFKITGTALGTTRNVSKAAVNTIGNIGVRTTKGVTKLVKNSINLASNITAGTLKGISRTVKNGKKTRRGRRRA
jgi:hypothetical protein